MKRVFGKLIRIIPRPDKQKSGVIRPSSEHPLKPPKPPIPLPGFYMLSHLEEDGPVRLDGVKLGVCEVMGLELDEPRRGSFAGALNALDFPVQLSCKATPSGAGQLKGDPQGGPARGPATQDKGGRRVPSWPSQGP